VNRFLIPAITSYTMTLSADTAGEMLRWLDDPQHCVCGEGWLLLRLVTKFHLRRPLARLGTAELFDRKEDAYACVTRCCGDRIGLSGIALQIGHVEACRRHVPLWFPQNLAIGWFRLSCRCGQLELVKWLTEQFELAGDRSRSTGNSAFLLALRAGQTETAEWLKERFDLEQSDVDTMVAHVQATETNDLQK
jgi:hypothetical protein